MEQQIRGKHASTWEKEEKEEFKQQHSSDSYSYLVLWCK